MEDGYFELENYGVKLKRLTHDKIEMVRQWRNDPKISQYMFYKEYITTEMQERWFANLDNSCNCYFIIEYGGKEIGLINIKDIDWDNRIGEPGQFIYDDDYLDSDVALRAAFCMCDWLWNELKLNALVIEVLNSNKRALNYNYMLGYEDMPFQKGDPHNKRKLILTRNIACAPNKRLDRLHKIFNKTK